MNRVKLALIGVGVVGKRHLAALQHLDIIELVAIVDPAESARQIAKEQAVAYFSNVEHMLESCRPDGVVVATPTEHHLHPTISALSAGVDVLIEKPITATLEEAAQVLAASSATGHRVLVGHQRRYYSLVKKARDLIHDGSIGQLVAVNGQWTMRKPAQYYKPDWRKRWQAGPIMTNLIHDMDLLRYLVGDVASLSAETSNAVMGFEKEDAAAIIFKFESGAIGTFLMSDQTHSPWGWESATGENQNFPRIGKNAYRFIGTDGALEFPNLRLWHTQQNTVDWTKDFQTVDIEMPFEDAFKEQLRHFAAVIRRQADPMIDAHDASKTLSATLAVYDAARSGKRVEPAPVPPPVK